MIAADLFEIDRALRLGVRSVQTVGVDVYSWMFPSVILIKPETLRTVQKYCHNGVRTVLDCQYNSQYNRVFLFPF